MADRVSAGHGLELALPTHSGLLASHGAGVRHGNARLHFSAPACAIIFHCTGRDDVPSNINSNESEARMNPSRRRNWLAILVGIVLLSGCSRYSEGNFDVVIQDDANLLSLGTKKWLKTYHYPQGYAFAIRSVRSMDPATIGVAADDLFSAMAALHPQRAAFAARGVLVLVSRNPALIQVRVGKDLYSLAQWGGVTAGTRYIESQNIAAHGDLNSTTRQMIDRLSLELPALTNMPWYKRWLMQDIISTLNMQLDSLSLPSDGFYGHYILKPIITLRLFEKRYVGTWWIAFAMVGVCIFLFKKLIFIAIVPIISRLTKPAIGNSIGTILSICFALLLTIPSAGSAIHLSGSRLEDRIALEASGLPGFATHVFEPDLFNQSTGLLITALIIGMRILKGFADRAWMAGLAPLPDKTQNALFDRMRDSNPLAAGLLQAIGMRPGKLVEIQEKEFLASPFSYAYVMPIVDDFSHAIRWGLLAAVFLPLALSLAIVYSWLVPIALGVYGTIKSVRDGRAQAKVKTDHTKRSTS